MAFTAREFTLSYRNEILITSEETSCNDTKEYTLIIFTKFQA